MPEGDHREPSLDKTWQDETGKSCVAEEGDQEIWLKSQSLLLKVIFVSLRKVVVK